MEVEESASTSTNLVDDSTITMVDVLEQEKEMEDEYAAVLGASDEKCCTYNKGAVKRQALYSCLTCCPEAQYDLEHCAGVCLACSYRCHENHDLVELYTKRNFRCDCPTERISGNRCTLNVTLSAKEPRNKENIYNHNFQGIYCVCKRPYPDPERTTADIMLQCSICEDWFHSQHLDVSARVAKLVDVCSEMICGGCMKQYSFLCDYTGIALKSVEQATNALVTITADVTLCEDHDNKLRSDLDKSISEIMNMGEGGDASAGPSVSRAREPDSKRQRLENSKDKQKVPCRRPMIKTDYKKGATFWGNEWRLSLCQCFDCQKLYKSQKLEFLLDLDDSAKAYEERGLERAESESSTYEEGIRALASIGHTQQIDAITEYNRMKDKLKDYLQTFAVNKKVVTEEDINRFFAEMRNERNDNAQQPYFCR